MHLHPFSLCQTRIAIIYFSFLVFITFIQPAVVRQKHFKIWGSYQNIERITDLEKFRRLVLVEITEKNLEFASLVLQIEGLANPLYNASANCRLLFLLRSLSACCLQNTRPSFLCLCPKVGKTFCAQKRVIVFGQLFCKRQKCKSCSFFIAKANLLHKSQFWVSIIKVPAFLFGQQMRQDCAQFAAKLFSKLVWLL